MTDEPVRRYGFEAPPDPREQVSFVLPAPPESSPPPAPQDTAEAQLSRLAAADQRLAGASRLWMRLGLFGGGLLLLLILLAIDWALALADRSPALAWVAAAAIGLMALGLGLWAFKESVALGRLGTAEAIQARLDPATAADTAGTAGSDAVPFDRLLEAATLLRRLPDYGPALDRWRAQAQPDHPPAAQVQLFEALVLAERDRAAIAVVRTSVRDAFMTVALSPTTLTDTLLFAWRAMRLVRQVAEVYGLKPGLFARLRLARQVLMDLGTLTAADLAGDAVSHMLGDKLLGRVSVAAGEGAVAAWRMARLGLMILDRCRPVPFAPGRRPALTDVRPVLGLERRTPKANHPGGDQPSDHQ